MKKLEKNEEQSQRNANMDERKGIQTGATANDNVWLNSGSKAISWAFKGKPESPTQPNALRKRNDSMSILKLTSFL